MIKNASNNNTITTKAKYWVGVGYPENMVENWEEVIGEVLQVPFAYCVHDKDKTATDKEDRKAHVHIMVAFPNTTTYKNALSIFDKLSDDGKQAFNTCEKVNNVRFMYNYLIHDTEDCRKKHKHQYSPLERITGNNFDIGAFEQISLADKHAMVRELSAEIIRIGFQNYLDFYAYVLGNFDVAYSDLLISYSGHFERLTKGNYQKWLKAKEEERSEH